MTGFWESLLEEREEREEAAKETLNAYTHEFCFVSEACPFDCIAITAPNPRASKAYLGELVHRVDGKGGKEVLILAVSDPKGVRIGSGGGTLNAILEVKLVFRNLPQKKVLSIREMVRRASTYASKHDLRVPRNRVA